MAKFKIALNVEYCRSADMYFEAGVKTAAELGYDWIKRVLRIMEPVDREIFLSVECGTIDEAAISLTYLRGLLGQSSGWTHKA